MTYSEVVQKIHALVIAMGEDAPKDMVTAALNEVNNMFQLAQKMGWSAGMREKNEPDQQGR